MIKLSAMLAILFGLALAVGEVIRNWGDWQWWPFWLVDYVAAALLIFGGQRALNTGTVRWLTGAWGWTAAMFWMSFFAHIQPAHGNLDAPSGLIDRGQLVITIGIMFGLSIFGFLLALLGDRNPNMPKTNKD